MRHEAPSFFRHNHLHRRSFLKITGIASAATVLGVVPAGQVAFAAALTKAQRDKLTPDDVIALMKKGNQRFRLGKETPHDYLAQQKASAKGQYPAAVILSCIDSRAPAETIMDLGIGDTFNARVAGNIANDDILGSIEFACKLSGAKVVLELGQGRDRQRTARKSHGAARQDTPCGGGNPISGRTFRHELWFCRRRGAQERRADDDRHPSSQSRTGRPRNIGCDQDRGSDVQPGNGSGRILGLRRHHGPIDAGDRKYLLQRASTTYEL